jgi:hypothetical protein
MTNQLLRDPETFPADAVLEQGLGRSYSAFVECMRVIASDPFRLESEWRFYKDGKAWLCKITRNKKTVAWLSAWHGCFKVACYFTERSGAGIPDLSIDDALKERYRTHAPIGRLKPLVVEVRKRSQLSDVFALLEYKAGTL